ncbi:vanadium-dependent haloperoxidase [Echinicola vietnamensis]|uniref:PAP2 superfamily protein n=1 Tax=Echinicola vietnamensis (strain DSM 17526 / LMG 23754 / KMM 6221) TaxID=926556 RepID=L0FRN2_ECHVK|nr:vanadium-dependent haloperoxidase [Echinicola vietnamensis]AGA76574.1 PAP2 superfamily protein [Echinicola vietnamensis DSM 17526]
MKRINFHLLYCFLLATLASCQSDKQHIPELPTKYIGEVTQEMTELMIHDVTNPPLAARFFSYACITGYEITSQNDSSLHDLHGILNQYPAIQKPTDFPEQSYQLSAVLGMIQTAKTIQPSGTELQRYEDALLDSCRKMGFPEETIQQSLAYAKAMTKAVLEYAKADGYNLISNYPRYTPLGTPGSWYPTPPGYFAPVEPYFETVRPFFLDSAAQFKPLPPIAFAETKDSEFYKITKEVYDVDMSEKNKEIAAFWDCNPFALQDNGHLMVGMKKISPGAHWMGITNIACQKAKSSFSESMKIHTMVATTLMDGFIACWDEKYRSNRIRPETAIRKYIDPTWTPFLQTPPFPEYLSGHSTISTAAAAVLTHYFGDNFSYSDTVEERYGLKARSYTSFNQAANEAAISRLYGGIHFMDAITRGQKQGREVGAWVIDKLPQTDLDAAQAAKN